MNKYMYYKGYIGSIEHSEEDPVIFGHVLGIKALISYDGETPDDLASCFRMMVDDYLACCEEEGIDPEKTDINKAGIFTPSEPYRTFTITVNA